MTVLAILGASDPEMERVQHLLEAAGVETRHAHSPAGIRVRGGEAFRGARPEVVPSGVDEVVLVECRLDLAGSGRSEWATVVIDGVRHDEWQGAVTIVDHHSPGDPGYGRPPEEFLPASSVGQVLAWLAKTGRLGWTQDVVYQPGSPPGTIRYIHPGWHVQWHVQTSPGGWSWIPQDLVLAAASDHCPAAAYRGRCPGVTPEALMDWRVRERAQFQGTPAVVLLERVAHAVRQIETAPRIELEPGIAVADFRGRYVAELPEASLRLGVPVLCTGIPGSDGREKINVLGDHVGDVTRAFLGHWAEDQGYVDMYPTHDGTSAGIHAASQRGFAGAYAPRMKA